MKLALVTDAEHPALTSDDAPLLPAFAAAGVRAVPANWRDDRVDWRAFDGVWIRSPWDYHAHETAFDAWLDQLDTVGARVWNPTSLLRWNARKSYLAELDAAGLPVIPSRWLPAGTPWSLDADRDRWGDLVVKPEIGGAGAWTYRVGPDDAAAVTRACAPRAAQVGFLVQPFLPAIAAGELSLVFLDGEYSHAVRKVAKAGDFRIHEEHGGRVLPAAPDPETIALAARFVAHRPGVPYARVDLVEAPHPNGAPAQLVELELIEPELFFRFGPGAIERFVTAAIRTVRA
jgi:glutathione synthase/RimK-type ligase-like ATP-grasp enzyme